MIARAGKAACLAALLTLAPPPPAAAQATAPEAQPSPAPARPRRKTSAPKTPPDVFFLAGGDRVSGRTLSKGRRAFVVQTPYGRLTLPRDDVARIAWGDGREEILRPEAAPSPAAGPAPPAAATLVLAVAGASFWYAWDRRETVDPTLRLQLWLDERELATYVDPKLDPQDLPRATVNSFSFDPAELRVLAAEGVEAAPPETRPGRVTLRLKLAAAQGDAAAAAQTRRLRLAYQINTGTLGEPAWRDVAGAALDARLEPGHSTVVELSQDAGRMEFSGFGHKRMKNVGSFRLEARPELDSPPAQP